MRLKEKCALVTGGAGFIGSHLVDALQERECRVRVLDNFSTGSAENLAHLRGLSQIEIIPGDVGDAASVAKVLQGAEVVFHLATRGVRHSIGHPLENHEVNAWGTLVLLDQARKAGVQRFVHVSSSEVYGTARYIPMDENHPCFPETVYGAAKLAGEAYARAYHQTYGLPTVVVRPFNNFGPRSHYEGDAGEVIPRFTVWALNGRPPIIFGDGTQTRDFIYVEDTAHWLWRVAECDELIGQTINLGSGKETAVRELAKIVCEEVGRPELAPEFHPPRPGDVRRHRAGVERAQKLLGLHLRIPLREGIRKLIEQFRAKGDGGASLLGEAPTTNWTPVSEEPHAPDTCCPAFPR
jgi:UDP-glucose 4-epimerase